MSKGSTYSVNIGPGNTIGAMAVGPGAVAVGGGKAHRIVIVYHPTDEQNAKHLRTHLSVLRSRGVNVEARSVQDPGLSDAIFAADMMLVCLSPDMLVDPFFASPTWRSALSYEKDDALRIVGVVMRPCFLLGSAFDERANLPHYGRVYIDGDRDKMGTEIARTIASMYGFAASR